VDVDANLFRNLSTINVTLGAMTWTVVAIKIFRMTHQESRRHARTGESPTLNAIKNNKR
jgi:hypothetical protein